MSSVSFLNARPNTAILFCSKGPVSFSTSSTTFSACCSLVSSVAFSRIELYPKSSLKLMSAWRSLWKQLPPYPGPAFKKRGPIRGSRPIASATWFTSTPGIVWAMLAIVLMKLTFVARNALLAYLTSSAVSGLVRIMGGRFLP